MAECNVVLNTIECQQDRTRSKCWGCGNDACTGCSRRMRWYRRPRVRVCNDCQEELRKDDRV